MSIHRVWSKGPTNITTHASQDLDGGFKIQVVTFWLPALSGNPHADEDLDAHGRKTAREDTQEKFRPMPDKE